MQVGDIVFGKITGIKSYGAFVRIGEYTGLIHISEFSDDFVRDINDIVVMNEKVAVKIVSIDEETKQLKLSYKQANVLPAKLLEKIHIYKGFNALEIQLDKWIEQYYEKIMKEREEKNELH